MPVDFAERFEQLDCWLHEHQALWRGRPFMEHRLDWEAQYPQLAAYLRRRSLADAERVHNHPHTLDAPAPFPGLAASSRALSEVDIWSEQPPMPDERLGRHVPGRKLEQIGHFVGVALARLPERPEGWLDWCAGKGHLGRQLALATRLPLTCLEREHSLNEQGRALSESCGVAAQHLDADVLAVSTWGYLDSRHTAVALHACGQLHMTLLTQAAANGCSQLVLSPCCYNRIDSTCYQPLSQRARHARLQPTRDDLGLPLQEAVTAGQRTLRLRDQSMAWRLAFDLWQREARGVDAYLPTPSRPESALAQGIAGFCRSLAEHHGLALPEPDSWTALEQRGWARLAEVRNLELVPALFRRPLEVWLLLDRALFLQEQGYRVQLGQFCPQTLTPRNFMLIGSRN
jgi:hypothetical protein